MMSSFTTTVFGVIREEATKSTINVTNSLAGVVAAEITGAPEIPFHPGRLFLRVEITDDGLIQTPPYCSFTFRVGATRSALQDSREHGHKTLSFLTTPIPRSVSLILFPRA
ncbi:unnamed protein product [Arabidopsis arenosa]|uniref:Uncharacterized protein n=1 Tax=Arabidopsis arenosa TaxID=38785 RepID=A0A8S1ZJW8_ARAAE|nr:unnamed protein product [Arabidopsis arenosa]CAE6233883.1 unnamed protein product [Arabidopsis arenosa]